MQSGSVTISDTVIHSNTAEEAGDDICVKSGAFITISPVGTDWILEDCGHTITGWYQDTNANRWSDENITEEVTTLTSLENVALKAAHRKIDTPVHPTPDPAPTPDPDPTPDRPSRDDDDDWEPLPDAPVKDKPEKVEVETVVPEETETPTEQPDKYNPETGDTTTVFAAMALAAVSLGGVVLLGRKKK